MERAPAKYLDIFRPYRLHQLTHSYFGRGEYDLKNKIKNLVISDLNHLDLIPVLKF